MDEIYSMSSESQSVLSNERHSRVSTAVVVTPETFVQSKTVLELCRSLPSLLPCTSLHPIQPALIDGGPRQVVNMELMPLIRQFINDSVYVGKVNNTREREGPMGV